MPDEVTHRDVYDLAQRIDEKLDDIKDWQTEHETADMKRFTRIYLWMGGIAIAVASPKVGGPSVPEVIAFVKGYV